ncbi:MAG: hypothetical protein GTO40_13995, partial [Deltaproteobacteria bacterium]|nr:hypothetical protein [Deltaproteobacteria bacterium]
ERLGQYLWFGNIKELETVIARTLTVSRKRMVDSEDLVWSEPATSMDSKLGEVEPRDQDAVGAGGPEGRTSPTPSGPSNGDFSPIRNFVNELAHELKNPMVTVKTYAQLLAERFDDETFRTSFQDRVGSDIERMDDLVEALVEYSKYDQPKPEVVDLHGQLQLVLEALIPESVKREMSVRWGNRGEGALVRVDQDQFRCAFKNLVLTALSQGKSNQEVQVNVNGQGEVTLSFVPEEGSPVFQGPQTGFTVDAEEEPLPLRVVLARDLLERMGGDIEVSHPGDSKVQFKVIVPTPSALN